ncbi:hypothetical protein CYMTET_53286 [Cymbomonas tetramitiformis]|uniref:Uncharacterized protein n=1 Tax=Cymbomonas tetramitiformis TaxID=36881 RepID=A0AAE0BHI2_9CHLO|nr:hypothetical protein CYMTET_53286 [Cymbomonas tetramitiformis]
MDSDSDDSQKFYELKGGQCQAGFAHEDADDDDDDETCFLSATSLPKKDLKRPAAQAALSPVAAVSPAKKAKPALNDWDGLDVGSSSPRGKSGRNAARPRTQPSASYTASRDALRRNQEMLAKLQKPADLNISDEEEDIVEIVEEAAAGPVDNGKPISLNLRLSEKLQTQLCISTVLHLY